jgi:cephalosporin hydroxylase
MRIWAEAFEPSFLIGVEAEQTPRTQEPLAQMCEDTGAGVIFGDTCAPETLRYVEHFLDGLAVDFLYIDADHRFESVSKDFHTYAPLVRDGGLIVLDDAVTRDNPTTEVYQLVAQLKQRGPTSLIYGGGDSGGKLAVFR